jgi:hypothetical protein
MDVVMNPNKWSTGDHSLWQEANLRIARKGLKMTRIFILKDIDFLRDEFPLAKTMKEQSEAGILVRYVTIDELEPELIRDGAILDDNMVITSLFTPAGEYGLLRHETSSAVVEDNHSCFKRILARSHPFENNASSDNQ